MAQVLINWRVWVAAIGASQLIAGTPQALAAGKVQSPQVATVTYQCTRIDGDSNRPVILSEHDTESAAMDACAGESLKDNKLFQVKGVKTVKTGGSVASGDAGHQHKVAAGSLPIPAPRSRGAFTTLRVRDKSEQVGAGSGAFRVPCTYSHMGFDDPIVFPGQPGASHLHVFFGNTSTNASSTTQSLFDASSSTCRGGIANRSSYWVPAIIDSKTNKAISPDTNVVYYKRDYKTDGRNTREIPRGLRMIAGNQVTQSTEKRGGAQHGFECWSKQYLGGRSGKRQSIPACSDGKILLELHFPTCWNGKDLDSPNHRSHMAYSSGVPRRCPSSHPVMIPAVQFNIHYNIAPGQDASTWRLSSDAYAKGPGGYSMHGDAWFNWMPEIQKQWLDGCVRSNSDCHAHLLGNGKSIF